MYSMSDVDGELSRFIQESWIIAAGCAATLQRSRLSDRWAAPLKQNAPRTRHVTRCAVRHAALHKLDNADINDQWRAGRSRCLATLAGVLCALPSFRRLDQTDCPRWCCANSTRGHVSTSQGLATGPRHAK